MQAAAQSSRTSRSSSSPQQSGKGSRSPDKSPVSLTFVPNPCGVGGVLVPQTSKPASKSGTRSNPSSDFRGQSEEGHSTDAGSNTSSPVPLLPSGSHTTGRPPTDKLTSPVSLDPPGHTICSPIKAVSGLTTPNLSYSDSCISETLLLNNAALLGSSSNSPADQLATPAWQHATALSSSVPPAQPSSNSNLKAPAPGPSKQFETPPPPQLRQSILFCAAPPVQLSSLLQPPYPDPTQTPFQSSSSPQSSRLSQQGTSSPIDSGLSSYSPSPPAQTPPFVMSQPQTPQQKLAQLLLLYPHLCQQQLDLDFAAEQLSQHLPSVGSNLSLSSSSSVCFLEPSIADQMDFPLMDSPKSGNMLLNSDPYSSLSPVASSDYITPKSVVMPDLDAMSHREYGSSFEPSIGSFVAAQSPFTTLPSQRMVPSPFYGRAASVHTSCPQSKVMHCQLAICYDVALQMLLQVYTPSAQAKATYQGFAQTVGCLWSMALVACMIHCNYTEHQRAPMSQSCTAVANCTCFLLLVSALLLIMLWS